MSPLATQPLSVRVLLSDLGTTKSEIQRVVNAVLLTWLAPTVISWLIKLFNEPLPGDKFEAIASEILIPTV